MNDPIDLPDEQHDKILLPRLLPYTISIIALLFIGTIGFSAYLGNHAMKVISPQVAAVHEIRTEIALAHLLVEEVILVDSNAREEDVWDHYDQAQWFVDALLKGGLGYEGKLVPVKDAELRGLLKQTAEKIAYCREITKKRFTVTGNSHMSSQIDDELDLAFDDLMSFSHGIEIRILKVIEGNSSVYNRMQIGLLFGCLLLSCSSGIAFYRYNRSRSAFLATIAEQNRQLLATNQQLMDSEQALRENEEKIRMNEARLGILWELSQYRAENMQDLLDYALEKAIQLTGSAIGYIYHYSEEKKKFILNSFSKDVMKECLIVQPKTIYQLEKTGIWGEAVRQGKPIILNDFQAPHPLKNGYPEGYSHLSSCMTVPLYSGKRIIAVVGLANKKTGYDESDILQTTLLMDSVWRIIDRKQAEDEIELLKTQTEKLESLGLLAGGIAHDFNNLLTAIMGNISLVKMHMPAEGAEMDMLNEAEMASYRARDLTQQLLTFAKGGAPIKETASISSIISDAASFALRGTNIAFDLVISDGLWHVEVDTGQMSQVFHNLVINASHAMPDGGTISVHCENLDLQNASDLLTLRPGRYVKISVKDQGIGISEEYLTRIFDPYFTTKQRGSGLGLATVYSIIRKHDGDITVESKLGTGSTFHIYLPASAKEAEQKVASAPVFAHEGTGRILIMDDEETVRNIAGGILKTFGYEIGFAGDGSEALSAYQHAASEKRPFDLVIMDLTVPGGMGGRELIKRLLEIDPRVRAIVSSGYSNDPVMAEYQKYGFRGVVSKPYNALSLAGAVKKVLES